MSSARFTAALSPTTASSPVSDLFSITAVSETLATMSLVQSIVPRHFLPRREYIWTYDVSVVQNGVIT